MTEQVCYFLLPAISSMLDLQMLLKTLVEAENRMELQTVWMLYSLVLILQHKEGKYSFYVSLFLPEFLRY